jgi:hypothetical protein
MAEHYSMGGRPPWVAGGGGSVKAPLLQNDYSAHSNVTYPPTQPHPTQFGVYGNVPPGNTHSTGAYSNATGVTGHTAASYHTAKTIPQTPPPQRYSPPPQTIGAHSQYTSTTSSYDPYGAPPVQPAPSTVYNSNSNPYSTPYSAPASPAPPAQVPYDAVPAYAPAPGPAYAAPRLNEAASSHGAAPAYSSGGAYGGNEYPKEKGWEYTAPPGAPPKQ